MASSPDNEIALKFRFFQVYKDARVELFRPPCKQIPPSDDQVTGVQSRDVIISSEPRVSARIFLPKIKNPDRKLPLLLYIHGGGFSMQSAFSPVYHKFCNLVASEADFIVVSVEYGLFPARPIPACYEDSWAVLRWVASHVDGNGHDPWLNDRADFGKVFIGGDSAGGNISHTLAFRVGSIGLRRGVRVVGVVMVHPFFGGTKDDEMWLYMCPTNSGLNDPRMNPGTEDLARLGCERMLIFVAEEDYLTVASKNYYKKLTKSGWKGTVELVENEKEDHCFHLFDLDAEKALEMRHKFVSFLKQDHFNLL
ncbi:ARYLACETAMIDE DEACETYLASE [Salix purpurea]|uniref:ARYLACETAMIDE DEACETYLASE n=1 Tax=Salix purpurea TaxID=77065 RepID=A0A9Q0PQC8_SALPP|nr:ARYLACETAMIDE DEACETYLASE [Salix purpurea]